MAIWMELLISGSRLSRLSSSKAEKTSGLFSGPSSALRCGSGSAHDEQVDIALPFEGDVMQFDDQRGAELARQRGLDDRWNPPPEGVFRQDGFDPPADQFVQVVRGEVEQGVIGIQDDACIGEDQNRRINIIQDVFKFVQDGILSCAASFPAGPIG